MNGKEVMLSRLNRMMRDIQDMINIVKTIEGSKPRADKKYASNSDKCKAYRSRKKVTDTQ